MSLVALNEISVSYDKEKSYVLKDLSLAIEQGELISLLGPSGCGKTTTLRVIAGLIQQNAGQFILDGKDITNVPVHKRGFGMVFQSYALFPHLSVFDNVAFGLKNKKLPAAEIEKRVQAMMTICGLDGFENRFPKQLSGGQRQRVALARSLVIEPQLLLLDEPLSNLDAQLRITMRMEIKRIQQQLGITTVFVTHDQEECFSISDRVAVMNGGVIEQFDRPEVIYHQPKTRFVAQFIGFENFIPVTRKANHYVDANGSTYQVTNDVELLDGDTATLTIRPENIVASMTAMNENALVGEVLVRTFLGRAYQYEVVTSVGNLLINAEESYEPGTRIHLYLPADKLVALTK
ncbi:ABC transporter ATP-binding protein [Aerococcus agrisoli]|uniref:ABC transporter ATP-binding protein n=1 Tax=Aerococcus agrisoli TaxID=2487350 RepID=A0A3N4FYZ2_9LACT|nr:ABC transporter ATP-binding protein [Aerococcus agrisoli]RPA55899.1 ABC transporter ATP-binding protein [Aerococcus agrisoli]